MFTGGTARLLISNGGTAPLEVTVEPWADLHRLPPDRTCVVVTHSPTADGSWSGTLRENEPFQVEHRPDSVTVWANGVCFHLTDADGNTIEADDSHCPARRHTS
ncbi:hypothetical protein [Streptomyces sp. NPDC054995]